MPYQLFYAYDKPHGVPTAVPPPMMEREAVREYLDQVYEVQRDDPETSAYERRAMQYEKTRQVFLAERMYLPLSKEQHSAWVHALPFRTDSEFYPSSIPLPVMQEMMEAYAFKIFDSIYIQHDIDHGNRISMPGQPAAVIGSVRDADLREHYFLIAHWSKSDLMSTPDLVRWRRSRLLGKKRFGFFLRRLWS